MELLIALRRGSGTTLGRQIEDQMRGLIHAGTLRPGARLPSTRELAGELKVSRPIVVDAYAQLASEGFLVVRQGSRPRVADCVVPSAPPPREEAVQPEPRFDFRPGVPDLSTFPRHAWLRATRDVLRRLPHSELGYVDPHGVLALRRALCAHLARVRGVTADPGRLMVTGGWAQGRVLLLRALKVMGARRIAIEDPCLTDTRKAVEATGLQLVPIPVDASGLDVEVLARANPDAVIVTPAHQYPSGVVLSGERRAALLDWVRRSDGVVVEDDYDAEYRYDRAPVGALQGLDPERIVYAGTVSKTLAPALRLGWMVVPPRLLDPVREEQLSLGFGVARIEQHVFAEFIVRGDLDRHLRRMRVRYRGRRDALVEAVARWMPGAEVCGVAAGLHAVVRLPHGVDEEGVRRAAERLGIAFSVLGQYEIGRRERAGALILGYARHAEEVIRAGVRRLAEVAILPPHPNPGAPS